MFETVVCMFTINTMQGGIEWALPTAAFCSSATRW